VTHAKDNSRGPSLAAPKPPKPKRRFLKQPQMLRVVAALVPIVVAGVYFFGWRVLALLGVCVAAGLGVEWLMESRRGKPVSQACFVTCFLYALSLPPTLPLWMAVVGIVVAILFGKMVFGGFGRNFVNPAILGRAFVYVAFPVAMTGSFVPAADGFPGGLGAWSVREGPGVDAVTAATPMWARRDYEHETPISDLFLGNIGGAFEGPSGAENLAAGSIGEVSALLILLAGIYLIVTKTANWRLMASALVGAVAANTLFRYVLGSDGVPALPFTLCSGALLFAVVFMVTDPVSAPKTKPAVWMYGALIGALIVFLRWKSQFAGAVGFAILLGNVVGPSLDMAVTGWKDWRKARGGGAE